ncbi:MAG TPA: hypothetical protein VGI19_13945, partial [Candidatus Cybelea sp.]
MSALPIFNDRNVYILGAGFSREAGLPLVSDFLNRMRDSRSWLVQQGRQKDVDAIDNLFAFRLKAGSAAERVCINLEDIEQLFSLVAASEGDSLTNDVIMAIAATLDFAEATQPMRREGVSAVVQGVKIPSGWKLMSAPGARDSGRYECSLFELYMLVL